MENDIETKFKLFLDESKLEGQGRWDLEGLSLEQKRIILMQQNKSIRKESISSQKSSSHSNQDLSTKFLHLINKLDYPEDVKAKLLRYAPQQKLDFIAKYDAFHAAPQRVSTNSQILNPDRGEASNYRRPSGHSRSSSASGESLKGSPRISSRARKLSHEQLRVTAQTRNSMSAYPEHSPMWFTVQISNRNTSMKALYRHLQALRSSFIQSGTNFIHEFISSVVPHLGNNGISGLAALEIALDRVCAPYLQKKSIARPAGRNSTLKTLNSQAHNWYADQILPDEIRLETIKCIEMMIQSDLGMTSVLSSAGLIRQIIWCFSIPTDDIQLEMVIDSRLRKAYLELITIIAEIMGTAALLDAGLKETILRVMQEQQRHQSEPYPFFYLVTSLKNPFLFNRNDAGWETGGPNDIAFMADYVDLWNFRTQLMVFFNGIVSSGDSVPKRVRVRTMLESCGLRPILKALKAETPTEEFALQVRAYEQDRREDIKEVSKAYSRQNVDAEQSSKMAQDLFQSVRTHSDTEMMNHFVISILACLKDIVQASDKTTKRKSSFGSIISDRGEMDVGAIMSLLEKSAKTVSESVRKWDISKPDSNNMELFQNNFVESIHDFIGKTYYPKNDNIGAIVEELEFYKQKYTESKNSEENLKKDIEFLKTSNLFLSGDSLSTFSAIPANSQNYSANYDSVSGEITSYHKPSSSARTTGACITDLEVKDIASKDFLDSSESIENSKNFLNSIHKQPNIIDSPKIGMPVGMMWERIKSLEAHIKELERERQISRALEIELVSENNELNVEELDKVESSKPPAPPLPPMMPPAPVMPGLVPKLATDPALSKIAKAKRAMKALQWEKVPNHIVKQTIWNDIFKKAYAQDVLNEDELNELFCKPNLDTKPSDDGSVGSVANSPQRQIVRFLDKKTSQNLEIMINSFKIPHKSIRDAIIKINDKEMNFDRINRIYGLLPNQDVMKQILAYEGSISELGIAESFLYCIGEIPNLRERLRCMAFRHRFFQEYVEIKPDTLTLISACKEVQNSTKFSQILQVILVIGNYLNGSSFRGNAKGFRLNSLLNLKDTKSNKQKKSSTLLHYLVRLIRRKFPESLDFILEMPSLEFAAKISIHSLTDGITDLVAEFRQVKSQVEQAKEFGMQANDKFMEIFESFCEKTEPKLDSLQQNLTIMSNDLNQMFLNFGEDSLDLQDEPQEFFSTILKFSKSVTQVLEEIAFADAKANGKLERTGISKDALQQQNRSMDSSSTVRPTFIASNPIGENPMSNLKPVDGMDPFSKRLTVRGGKMPSFEEIQKLGATGAEYGMTSLLLKGSTSLAEARDTIQRVRSKRTKIIEE